MADKKVTALVEETSPALTDLVYVVTDPGGTPTSKKVQIGNLPGGSSGGGSGVTFKNLLINGDFRINQEGYVSAATLASSDYGHDGWKAGASGGDYSFTQLNASTVITIAASKTLIQVIENKNVQGGSYVLSWTGTAQGRYAVNSATPAGSYASSPITITGQSAGTTMSVEFDDGTLSNVQLEPGSTPSDFEHLPFDVSLGRCTGLYRIGGRVTFIFPTGGTGYVQGFALYGTEMRATPTVTTIDLAGNVGKVSQYTSGVGSRTDNVTASIGGSSNSRGFYVTIVDGTTKYGVAFTYTADARL